MPIHIDDSNLLGFGCMRLPLEPDQKTIDIPEFARMADLFMDRGFTYFDTSFVYHDGHSEEAVRRALVGNHPRDSFQIATKFPTMMVKTEEEVDGYFSRQLANLGVAYFDFYLLHILETQYLQNADGSPGVVETCHLFDHLSKWKAEGKIRHTGFSFHDSHDVLDKLLTEHPEVEFVQIVINYYDWDADWIQSKANLEVIRKHGKVAVAMEPVKGGYLSAVPDECLELMHKMDPDLTPAAWAVRFAASQQGVFKVLSGMSTMQQVEDNTAAFEHFRPLTDREQDMLFECARILREHGPVGKSDYTEYDGLTYRGIPVRSVLQTYNAMAAQPVPNFTADSNYLHQELLKIGEGNMNRTDWPEEKVEMNGKDITPQVRKAWEFVAANSF